MFKPGERLVVKETHKFWPGVAGTFEFMGGPHRDIVVLCTDKTPNYDKMIAVELGDIKVPIRHSYSSTEYTSPCGNYHECKVDVYDDYRDVSTYGCGCKVYTNEYGGSVVRCDGKPPCLLCHEPVGAPGTYCQKCIDSKFQKKK
jgi:hypothetical protein